MYTYIDRRKPLPLEWTDVTTPRRVRVSMQINVQHDFALFSGRRRIRTEALYGQRG
jgi:hypothetical protein